MQNSYIVDAFLSGAVWMLLIFLGFEVRARISGLSGMMTANVLALALTQYFKRSLLASAPFGMLLVFMLWRFYGLMVATQTWGAGGIGLLIGMLCIGLPLVWLQVMLIFVQRSSYISVPAPKSTTSTRAAP